MLENDNLDFREEYDNLVMAANNIFVNEQDDGRKIAQQNILKQQANNITIKMNNLIKQLADLRSSLENINKQLASTGGQTITVPTGQ